MLNRKILILFLFLISYSVSKAQFSIGISFSGIGFHPEDDKNKNAEVYDWKLDKKGKVVAYASVSFFLSYRYNDYIGAKLMQTIALHDCGGQFAGVTHFGIDLHDNIIGFKDSKNHLSMSVGPFWYYRKNWSKIPGYVNNPKFIKLLKNGIWERKFVWYGGQIEYTHQLNNNSSFSVNILPGYPFIYTFGLGGKWNFDINK